MGTNQRPEEAEADQSEAGRGESESERGAGNISRSRLGEREEIYLWYVWLKITAPLPKRKTFSKF